jgi:hypothetical protein
LSSVASGHGNRHVSSRSTKYLFIHFGNDDFVEKLCNIVNRSSFYIGHVVTFMSQTSNDEMIPSCYGKYGYIKTWYRKIQLIKRVK